MSIELIVIEQDGSCHTQIPLHPIAAGICAHTVENYAKAGYQIPWTGYLTFVNGVNVGTCAFKAPPFNGLVEIAYFTFPEFEGKGYGKQAAFRLIEIAHRAMPSILITAQTLPAENASTSILRSLGFVKTGTIEHQEDGLVWEWVLSKNVNLSKANLNQN